ncbi:MAG: PAS domain-containing protein, partial [Desulfobacterales bacterium]|nr:PAS domain-containing protein [Desulfobacterales bacterium]
QMPAAVFIKDDNCKVVYMNRHLKEVFGADDRWIGRDAPEIIGDVETARKMKAHDRAAPASGRDLSEERILDPDGAERVYETLKFRIDRGEEPPLLGGVARDVTAREKAEEARRESEVFHRRLFKAEKMQSLGVMAGGVAHDLNNILSGIVSYPELIPMDLPGDSPLRKPLAAIKKSGERAAELISDLLAITRGAAIGEEVWNLNDIIETHWSSPAHAALREKRPSIQFERRLAPNPRKVKCSSTHLRKSLENLITNASDAIRERGRVIVSTTNRRLEAPLKDGAEIKPGEYVVLSVADNGERVAPGDLERIFEPFYMRKVMGRRGAGLGLAVVWNTIRDHGGYIDVESGDRGTVFELYFPAARGDATIERL